MLPSAVSSRTTTDVIDSIPMHSFPQTDYLRSYSDPGWRSMQVKYLDFNSYGFTGTAAASYVDAVILPIYQRAFQTSIRFQTSFDITNLKVGIDNMTILLGLYYSIQNVQSLARVTGNRGLAAMNNVVASDFAVLTAMDKARIVLQACVMPPNVNDLLYRMNQIRYTCPNMAGTNGPYQMLSTESTWTIDVATVVSTFNNAINVINSAIVSTEIAKLKRLMPNWSLRLHDAQSEPVYDPIIADVDMNVGCTITGRVLPVVATKNTEIIMATRNPIPSVLIGALANVHVGIPLAFTIHPGFTLTIPETYSNTIQDDPGQAFYGYGLQPGNLAERSTQSSIFTNPWEVSDQALNAGYGAWNNARQLRVTGNTLEQDARTVADWLWSIDEVAKLVSSNSY